MKKPIPFGKYYLLERINVGGMAEVFRAKAYGVEGFERLVAVKRILPNIAEDKEFIGMFIDEAKIAVQLNHANIAQIFDLGMVDGSYYIALEHIHGRDLRSIYDRCREQSIPMPIAQAAFVTMKVCEGLDYAHNKRDQSGRDLYLVHRDVSPQNLLVSFEGEVKIIDFGIAKAAGKGSKTQAGILKGKFGYMSPEQVRGLPIDRRSDIFSAGIVLYELLTGERLFVGESDFSTLEKVRNVEILPPSTYNRKIPEELERIVLKALAKDVEDRYQNSIDLHDDLQAFVYQAGEFYSRKDLAGWMKKMFAREIEEETAKLESYRQLRPPEARPPQSKRSTAASTSTRRPTLAMPSVAPKPPPIPVPNNGRRSGPVAANAGPSPSASASMAAAPAAPAGAIAPAGAAESTGSPGNDLEWDDDELETQIYDSPLDEAKALERLAAAATPAAAAPVVPPSAAATQPMISRGAAGASVGVSQAAPPPPAAVGSPDLSSLVPGNRPWAPPPGAVTGPPMPAAFAVGSNPAASAPGGTGEPSMSAGFAEAPPFEGTGERSIPGGFSSFETGLATASMGSVQEPIDARRKGKGLQFGVVTAVVLIGGAVAAVMALGGRVGSSDGEDGEAMVAVAVAVDGGGGAVEQPIAAALELTPEILAMTGFDLIIEPTNAKVKLDDTSLDLTPPMKVRNIWPGQHVLVIQGPAGFFSKQQTITVEAGKAESLSVSLDPLDIVGRFASDPEGAQVTLIVNDSDEIPLGPAPQEYKLDPRKRYTVRFEKDGYTSKTEPLSFSGASAERLAVTLERAESASRADATRTRPTPVETVKKPPAEPGVLLLGSKPPCQIFIDGKDTGLKTPQKSISLSAGRHKITLINNEFGIKETLTVIIQPGEETKKIVDLSDRIQQK